MSHPSPFENEEMLSRVVERLDALADPVRLRILNHLRRAGESTVGALVEVAGVSQPSVSRHLSVLRRVGLVTMRQDGNRTLCTIGDEGVFSVCTLLCDGVVRQMKLEESAIRSAVARPRPRRPR